MKRIILLMGLLLLFISTPTFAADLWDTDGGAGSDTHKGQFESGLLGAELITNGDFANWTADDPDNWLVEFESGPDPEISEVGSAEGHGGVGTGSCNIYTTGSIVQVGQGGQYSAGNIVRMTFDITKYVAGTLSVQDTGTVLSTENTENTFTYNYVAIGNGPLFKRQGSADITFDDVSAKVADISWAVSSTNLVAMDASGGRSGGGLVITGDGSDDKGATLALSAASDLSSNLMVGATVTLGFDAKVGIGDSVDVEVAQSDDTELGSKTITSDSWATYYITFIASNATTNKIQLDNLANTDVIYLDNFTLFQLYPKSIGSW